MLTTDGEAVSQRTGGSILKGYRICEICRLSPPLRAAFAIRFIPIEAGRFLATYPPREPPAHPLRIKRDP